MSYFTITNGTITSPQGFKAGAIYAGIKKCQSDVLDVGIVFSENLCTAAGMFTANAIKAAPVLVSQEHIRDGMAQAIVVNSGCANACTGETGLLAARDIASATAKKFNIMPQHVLTASTGIIGVQLPLQVIKKGIEKIVVSRDNGHAMARAIMTTDTFPKEIALEAELNEEKKNIVIGGIAKGAGMIHPNLATMLCFLTTDANVSQDFLATALKKAVDKSFNMVTVDGDTSPNDSIILLANGCAQNRELNIDSAYADTFCKILEEVCMYLAKQLTKDGEGATKLIEVTVERAFNIEQARSGARTVAGSSLVKSAIHGSDPNWGRILAAIGRSGAAIDESKVDLYLHNVCLMKSGVIQPFDTDPLRILLDLPEVPIRINLNLGDSSATAWGCDLSEDYVKINSEYTT